MILINKGKKTIHPGELCRGEYFINPDSMGSEVGKTHTYLVVGGGECVALETGEVMDVSGIGLVNKIKLEEIHYREL